VLAARGLARALSATRAGPGRMGRAHPRSRGHGRGAHGGSQTTLWDDLRLTSRETAYPSAISLDPRTPVESSSERDGIVMRRRRLRACAPARPGRARAADASTSCSAVSSVLKRSNWARHRQAIASPQRVKFGNAAGAVFSSWLNPTSIMSRRARSTNSAYLAGRSSSDADAHRWR